MRRAILAILATAIGLALLLSFKTHGTASAPAIVAPAAGSQPSSPSSPASSSSGSSGSSGSGGSGGSSSSSGSSGTSGSGGSSAARTTVTGDSVQTIYGPIQVSITVSGGKITGVSVPVYPQGTMRDVQINQFAIPQLIQETEAANSANIDMVSGATYTSQGYIQSLQSALDKMK